MDYTAMLDALAVARAEAEKSGNADLIALTEATLADAQYFINHSHGKASN